MATASTSTATETAADLVLALASVDGASAACAAHGDVATAAVLSDYYALLADTIAGAEGRVVKVMGDGALLVFPAARAPDAVVALRAAQARGTARWRAFDPRCRVVVKATAGRVLCAPMGPPGDERPDVYGDALNRLFTVPARDLVLTPELLACLER